MGTRRWDHPRSVIDEPPPHGVPPPARVAERLRHAAREEFAQLGYSGARVKSIARAASCNVALLYRHWTSKQALYVDVLHAVMKFIADEVSARLDQESGAQAVVHAYVDTMMKDTVAARILVRELLDGGPFMAEVVAREPALRDPVLQAAQALAGGSEGGRERSGEAVLLVLSIGGLAALIAAARESARPFVDGPISPETWRRSLHDLLLYGAVAGRGPAAQG